MPGPSIWLKVNATACYVLAFLVTTFLHECGHAFTGAWLGSSPVLHHNYVEHFDRDRLALVEQIWIALAGPLVSLAQGCMCWWVRIRRPGGGIGALLVLWLAVLGFGNFFGYLMTGPFFTTGDLGKVEVLLGMGMITRIVVALTGAGVLLFIMYRATWVFLAFATDKGIVEDPHARVRFNGSIIMLPWLIGSMIVTLLYLPVIALISIIYPFTSGMVFIFPWRNAERAVGVAASGRPTLLRASLPLYLALAIAVVLFRGVLARGIPL